MRKKSCSEHGIVRVMIGLLPEEQGVRGQPQFVCSVVTKKLQLCREGSLDNSRAVISLALSKLKWDEYYQWSAASNGFYYDDVHKQIQSCPPAPQKEYMHLAIELGMLLSSRSGHQDNEAGLPTYGCHCNRRDLWDGVVHGEELASITPTSNAS